MILAKKELPKPKNPIQFINLKEQQDRIRPGIEQAILKVLDHGHYIMGPEVYELEKQLSALCGVKHTISCANGTDALGLGLMAQQTGPGHAIFVPSFTFAATAEVVAWMGATPIFIDVLSDTYNMDPASLEKGIKTAKDLGLQPYGIIPVDLFGLPADYEAIQTIARSHKLWILSDAAQSFGATYNGSMVGSIGDMSTTSFFPAKPLGCYGDGGAIFTNDDNVAATLKSLRVHGQGTDKYDNVRVGMNGRLDTLQAAILLEKLKIFPDEIRARQTVANYYNELLKDMVQIPHIPAGLTSAWAQYTIVLPEQCNREKVIAGLKNIGIPAMIYYVKPLHQQKAYQHYPTAENSNLLVCEKLANKVLSLPICGYTDKKTQETLAAELYNLL